MVKNYGGGNKAKGFANKHSSKKGEELRTSKDELEVYAQVETMSGGTLCRVKTLDGTEMICHIRGKFRGRGKRDNLLANGTWVLVGLRDWEKEPSPGKLLNCDLLEVYSNFDKERLQNTVVSVNWHSFVANDNKMCSDSAVAGEEILFATEETQEYAALIEMQLQQEKAGTKIATISIDNEEEIDVDDI